MLRRTRPSVAALSMVAFDPPLCGHVDAARLMTTASGPDTGQRWCGSCDDTFDRVAAGLLRGTLTREQGTAQLTALGIATPRAIRRFVRDHSPRRGPVARLRALWRGLPPIHVTKEHSHGARA